MKLTLEATDRLRHSLHRKRPVVAAALASHPRKGPHKKNINCYSNDRMASERITQSKVGLRSLGASKWAPVAVGCCVEGTSQCSCEASVTDPLLTH